MRNSTVLARNTNLMKRTTFILFILIIPAVSLSQNANDILKKSMEAYGGVAWDTIHYIRMHHIGHQHWLEQSENPQGPYITSYTDTEEIRSTRERKLYQKIETKTIQSLKPSTLSYVQLDTIGLMAFGERKVPMYYGFREENLKWMQYAPEYILSQAQKSSARLDKVTLLEGVKHYQLSFSNAKIDCKIFINASTHLISEAQLDTYSPNEFFFSLWGKFTTRVQYSLYALHKHNVVYPLQWDIYRTGQLWKKISINQVEFRNTVDESIFNIPDDIRKGQMPKQNVNNTKLPVEQAIEVAKGLFVIPGNWFTGWAEQEDGIVVIEAPISSGYSVQLMNEIKRRYPLKKIKGVVVSSDAWPHLAGVREYFSTHTPVYTNALNKSLLDRIATVDHSPLPDHQQNIKATPIYKLVDKTVVLNDRNLPIQIIPINGEGGECMVAVYFPAQKVLYASDLIQQQRDKSFFFIEYLAEVKALIDRHKLDVETVYAMHTKPLPWKEIEDVLGQNK